MALVRAPLALVGPAHYKARWYVDTDTGATYTRAQAYSRALGQPHQEFTRQRLAVAATGVNVPAPKPRIPTVASSKALETRNKNEKIRNLMATLWARQNGVSQRQALADPDFKGAWEMYKHSFKVKPTTMKKLPDGSKIPYYVWLRRPLIAQTHAPRRWEEYGPGDTP